MNAHQAEKFRALLIEACDKHLASGERIVVGKFYDGVGGLCPLTILFGNNFLSDRTETLSDRLGITIDKEELWAFVCGFDDGAIPDRYKKYVAAILLGKELRAKYVDASVLGYIESDTHY